MRNLSKTVRGMIVAVVLAAALAVGFLFVRRMKSSIGLNDGYQSMQGWQPISGRWTERAGVFSNPNYGRGDMLIAQHSQGADYRISAEIRFDLLFPETHYGDAGLVIRTTDPEQGVDSYQGYYAGIRPDNQTVVLGRASYEWIELKTKPLNKPISLGSWYRLELEARACNLTVTVTPADGGAATRIDYEDINCVTEGVAGLRSFYAQASWRDVKITRN